MVEKKALKKPPKKSVKKSLAAKKTLQNSLSLKASESLGRKIDTITDLQTNLSDTNTDFLSLALDTDVYLSQVFSLIKTEEIKLSSKNLKKLTELLNTSLYKNMSQISMINDRYYYISDLLKKEIEALQSLKEEIKALEKRKARSQKPSAIMTWS